MWDMQAAIPFGRLSKRNILLFVASVIATTFAYLFFAAAPVYAADAKWEQGSVIYDNTTFRGPAQPNNRAEYDLPDGTSLYIDLKGDTLKVVYFPAGSTPSSATSANYVTYRTTNSGKLSDKSDPKSITFDTSTSDQADLPTNSTSSSCKVDGIGWIVCPVTNFLATGMDWVFNILSGFVEVQPLETNTNSTMHRIWEIMRNFANVAFVIAFLIIIYSQLTSVGLTNYGIKKLLPRIIIAAILVNVSYWICTLAIDISNILGYSLQGIFLGLRDMVMAEGGGTGWQPVSWESIASFILAGGAVGGAAIASVILTSASMGAFTVGGVILLLLPILLGAFLTVLVVLFILAARQAIIVLLVIISPLALVAYLLPNTEKWFEKWRSLFMTMLIFFPAFSLVFGGAQFAGLMIINAAVAKGDINMMLLGMAVQIAPLAITPLLLKLSGTLLSRIGGLINDPSKGLKDRTKNWSKDRLSARKAGEDLKTRAMMQNGTLGKRHVVRRTALGMDTRRRLREGQKSVNETRATSLFNNTSAGSALNQAEREAEREKTTIQNKLESTWNIKAKIDPKSLDKELELRITADEANLSKVKMDSIYEEVKAGNRSHVESVYGNLMPYGPQVDSSTRDRLDMLNRATDATSHIAVEGMRKTAAEHEQKSNIAQQLLKNADTIDGKKIREYAGGIDEHGANSALATAVGIDRKQYNDRSQEANAILDHFNLSGRQRQDHAMGKKEFTVKDEKGNEIKLTNDSIFTREAAIEAQLSGKGNLEQMEEIILESGGSLKEYRTTISAAIPKNGIPGKAAYWGGVSIDEVAQGTITPSTANAVVTRFLAQGKVKPTQLATMDLTAVKRIVAAYQNPDTSKTSPADQANLAKYLKALQGSAHEALTNKDLKGNIADNVQDELRKITVGYTPPTP